jgi:hypothetical protein
MSLHCLSHEWAANEGLLFMAAFLFPLNGQHFRLRANLPLELVKSGSIDIEMSQIMLWALILSLQRYSRAKM